MSITPTCTVIGQTSVQCMRLFCTMQMQWVHPAASRFMQFQARSLGQAPPQTGRAAGWRTPPPAGRRSTHPAAHTTTCVGGRICKTSPQAHPLVSQVWDAATACKIVQARWRGAPPHADARVRRARHLALTWIVVVAGLL